MKTTPDRPATLLSISHSAVLGGYQERYSQLARKTDLEINLLVPQRWRQFNREIELEKTADPAYRIIARQPFAWGFRDHGHRNAAHIYPGLSRLIQKIRPAIIELWEEPFSAATFQAIRAARRIVPEAKLIFFSAQNIRKNYPPPFSWWENYTYRHADFAFVINPEAEAVIREKGWRKEALVLPLGVDPAVFRPSDTGGWRAKLGREGFTVGFIGKLERQKGILDLVRAAGRLDKQINFLIIGEGPLRSEILQLAAELGRAETVRVLPAVPYADLPRYFNCLDVLVLPSITLPGLKEQFGRVLVEAMSCSVPVIGSDSGEIPNVIGEAGLIFPEGDFEELARLLELLRSAPARRKQLAEWGRKRVEQNYSWEKIAEKQAAVYNHLRAL